VFVLLSVFVVSVSRLHVIAGAVVTIARLRRASADSDQFQRELEPIDGFVYLPCTAGEPRPVCASTNPASASTPRE
jgi:hypothetical protein